MASGCFFAGRGGGGGGVVTGSDEDNGAETERVWWTMTSDGILERGGGIVGGPEGEDDLNEV